MKATAYVQNDRGYCNYNISVRLVCNENAGLEIGYEKYIKGLATFKGKPLVNIEQGSMKLTKWIKNNKDMFWID